MRTLTTGDGKRRRCAPAYLAPASVLLEASGHDDDRAHLWHRFCSEDAVMTSIDRNQTLATFLSSSFFAEESAAPVVERLLKLPCDAAERRLIESWAAEEAGHAERLDAWFRRHAVQRGPPFWIQPLFTVASERATLFVQLFHLELAAAMFYGAVAARVDDGEVRELLRGLARDESRHIRLIRELAARELARASPASRLKALVISRAIHIGAWVTAHYQARQLEPLLGPEGRKLPGRLLSRFSTELERLFRDSAQPARPLEWWWSTTLAPMVA
jgi:rubrerythrin